MVLRLEQITAVREEDPKAGRPNAVFPVPEGVGMNIPIIQEGMLTLVFDEADVREMCTMLRCRKLNEECMALMSKRTTQCMACYIALRILNRPYRIRVSRHMAEQRN